MKTFKVEMSYDIGKHHVKEAAIHVNADTKDIAKKKAENYAHAQGFTNMKIKSTLKEEVMENKEQLDELSKETLNRVMDRAQHLSRIGSKGADGVSAAYKKLS